MKFLTLLVVSVIAVVGGSISSYAVKPHPHPSFGDPLRVEISRTIRKINDAMQLVWFKKQSFNPTQRSAVIVSELNKLFLLSEQFYDLFVAHRDYADARLDEGQKEGKEQVAISQLKRSAQIYDEWATEVFKGLVAIEEGLTQKHHVALRGILHEVNIKVQHLAFNPYMVEPLKTARQQFFIERHIDAYDKGELTANVHVAVNALAVTVADESMFWFERMDKVLEQVSIFITAAEQLRKFNNIKAEREPKGEHVAHYQQHAEQILGELQRMEATLVAIGEMPSIDGVLKEVFREARNAVTGERRERPPRSLAQLLAELEHKSDDLPAMEKYERSLSAAEHFSGSSSN